MKAYLKQIRLLMRKIERKYGRKIISKIDVIKDIERNGKQAKNRIR